MEYEHEEDEEEDVNWRQPVLSSYHFNGGKSCNNPCINNSDTAEESGTNTSQQILSNDAQGLLIDHKTKLNHTSTHNRCIIHIDFDCFYCQVEVIRNPALKDKPFGVYQKHIVVSSNYVARDFGVKKMSTRAEALKVCPDIVMVNGEDLTIYREYSSRMFSLLKKVSPVVERIGLDENYIDVTKNVDELMANSLANNLTLKGHCYGYEGLYDMDLIDLVVKESENVCDCGCFQRLAIASMLADSLRQSLFNQLGLTASAGIAHNKVLAKLIGKTHKPNQQTIILPTYTWDFLGRKLVSEIQGIGSRCSTNLKALGIETIADLMSISNDMLMQNFTGKQYSLLVDLSKGVDNSPVSISEDAPKTISEEESFRKLNDFDEVKHHAAILINQLLTRLEKDKRLPRTIRLSVRRHGAGNNFARISRQVNFDANVLKLTSRKEKIKAILDIVVALFDKMIDRKKGFDLAVINIGFANFDEASSSSTSTISKFFTKERASSLGEKNEGNLEERDLKQNQFCDEDVESCPLNLFSSKVCELSELMNDKNSDTSQTEIPNATKANQCISGDEINTSCFRGSYCNDVVKLSTKNKNRINVFSSIESQPKDKKSSETFFHQDRGRESLGYDVQNCSNRKTKISHEDLFKSTTVQPNECLQKEDMCPEGIDFNVFKELPVDIRQELSQSWKRKDFEVRSAPMKKKQKTKNNGKSSSILNFFSK